MANLSREQFDNFINSETGFFCETKEDAYDFLGAVIAFDTNNVISDVKEFVIDLDNYKNESVDEAGIYYFINRDLRENDNEFVFDSCFTEECCGSYVNVIEKWNPNLRKMKCPINSFSYCDSQCAWRINVNHVDGTSVPVCAVSMIGMCSMYGKNMDWYLK